MNLDRILTQHPGKDLRRIDIEIGEKQLWGRGIGTEAIRMLVEFGFERERADAIFGLLADEDFNPRSIRAFQKAGLAIDATRQEPPGAKARYATDLILTRETYEEIQRGARQGPVLSHE